MRALLLALLVMTGTAQAEDAAPATPAAEATAVAPSAPAEPTPPPPRRACRAWPAKGLPEGPVVIGYGEADLGVGRRACPRSEVGLGGQLGLKIDTPDFYGAVRGAGVLFGSWAATERLEVFAMLEPVAFTFAQNAVLTSTRLTLGHATLGGTFVLLEGETLAISGSARVLLPTSRELPGASLLGGEVSALATWRPRSWLEVHGAIGGDLTGALGRAAGFARGGATVLVGAQLSPFDWGALVVDLGGRLGAISSLAPAVALRFRVGPVGIDLGASLPLVGNDRHDLIAGLRVAWRLD
jgi:hypothetical protein